MIRYTTATVPPALEELGITADLWSQTPKAAQAVLLMQLMQLDVLLEKVSVLEAQADTPPFAPSRNRGGRPRKK